MDIRKTRNGDILSTQIFNMFNAIHSSSLWLVTNYFFNNEILFDGAVIFNLLLACLLVLV